MFSRWLLLVTLASSWFNVGLIWMSQVSVYPLWPGMAGGSSTRRVCLQRQRSVNVASVWPTLDAHVRLLAGS